MRLPRQYTADWDVERSLLTQTILFLILKFCGLCLVYTYLTFNGKMQMPTCATTTEKALPCLLSVQESACVILQSQPNNKQFLLYYKDKIQHFFCPMLIITECNTATKMQNCLCSTECGIKSWDRS